MKRKRKWAVIIKSTNKVYRTFESRSEASYCVTDCFGPDWRLVEIKELTS